MKIKSGKAKGNKMIDMQLNNEKLVGHSINFITDEPKSDTSKAFGLLNKYGSVKEALSHKHT